MAATFGRYDFSRRSLTEPKIFFASAPNIESLRSIGQAEERTGRLIDLIIAVRILKPAPLRRRFVASHVMAGLVPAIHAWRP